MSFRNNILKFLVLILCFPIFNAYGQAKNDTILFPKDAFFIEVLGQSQSILSVNYERTMWHLGKRDAVNLRLGIGYIPSDSIGNKYQKATWTLPLVISSYYGHKNHFLVIGAGFTFALGSNFIDSTTSPPSVFEKYEGIFSARIGYRYSDKSGLLFEAYPMIRLPIFGSPVNIGYFLFGIDIGYARNIK